VASFLSLETFEDPAMAQAPRLPEVALPTYDEGYAAGLAAAQAQLRREQAVLQDALVRNISECIAQSESAQLTLFRAIGPLFEAVQSQLLPALLAPALSAHIRELVEDALKADLQAPLRLTISPAHCDAVSRVLQAVTPNLDIVADPEMGPHAALLCTPTQETSLDLDGALAAIAAHMSALEEVTLTDEGAPNTAC